METVARGVQHCTVQDDIATSGDIKTNNSLDDPTYLLLLCLPRLTNQALAIFSTQKVITLKTHYYLSDSTKKPKQTTKYACR